MARIITVLTLILSILLFPPAALALISNNAIPGDATYPIKRFLEDRIYDVASLNPTTKAWFSAARSDRRFKEFSTLIAQGKSASDTLGELVTQTQIAAEQLKKVDDPIKKQELVSQLSQSIDKYSQKLEEVSVPPTVSPPADVTSPRPTATPRSILTPQPSEVPRPAPSPTQAPSSPQPSVDQKDLADAKEKLEDIKDKLEKEEKKSHQEKREDKREDRKNERSEKDSKKDKDKGVEKENSKTDKTGKKSDK